MKSTSKSVRASLVASIARDVEYLVKRDEFRKLEGLMETTGYLSNQGSQSSRSLGDAIVALATVLDMRSLEDVAHVATFCRHINPNRRRKGDWDRANAIADEALRAAGVDVVLRNAKAALAEAKDMADVRKKREEQAKAA